MFQKFLLFILMVFISPFSFSQTGQLSSYEWSTKEELFKIYPDLMGQKCFCETGGIVLVRRGGLVYHSGSLQVDNFLLLDDGGASCNDAKKIYKNNKIRFQKFSPQKDGDED